MRVQFLFVNTIYGPYLLNHILNCYGIWKLTAQIILYLYQILFFYRLLLIQWHLLISYSYINSLWFWIILFCHFEILIRFKKKERGKLLIHGIFFLLLFFKPFKIKNVHLWNRIFLILFEKYIVTSRSRLTPKLGKNTINFHLLRTKSIWHRFCWLKRINALWKTINIIFTSSHKTY